MFEGKQEHMFDKDSFKEEITSKEEAQAAYNYFAHNLTDFRSRLASSGMSYEEVEETIRQCWLNLIESSQRVGFTNGHLERMEEMYKGNTKELPKSKGK
jgi:hypothetical protein